MRIAQVSPLYESVPPRLYGGTERVVSYLTEALIEAGHEVTLFASGDSSTRAKLISACPRALRLDPECKDPIGYHLILLDQVFSRLDDFDVVHFHTDYLHFPLAVRHNFTHVTTLHGRLDLHFLPAIYQRFPGIPVISISYAQRKPLPYACWRGNVYHGLPLELYSPVETRGSYLAFLGRISPEKRADLAIEIALRAGIPIKIAAKIDKQDQDYFKATIEPLLRHPLVEFIGEVDEQGKQQLLGGALALLFPIDWPEPFGISMIESMACGTPVIAFPRGSVPEVVDDGITGLIVPDVQSAVRALDRVASLSRSACRRRFEQRFSAGRMARDYIAIYTQLVEQREILLYKDAVTGLT
jgi:glycosyltransferase involved in cell wall biosynthesis